MPELKPCPFCGTAPVLRKYDSAPVLACFGYFPKHYYSICCGNVKCGVSLTGFETRNAAIDAWNRRFYED